MLKIKKKIQKVIFKSIAFFFFLALVVLLIFEAYTLIIFHTEGNKALPSTFGNFESVRALLKDDGKSDTFSFALAGDTKGCGTFERICENLKEEPVAFMVLLGDCVRDGTPGYHRYFRAEWAKELATYFPVFYVVGNHDVDAETFPISTFEKTYGPTNFSFEYKGCLFIVLRILNKPYSTKESFAFLESVLSGHRSKYRKVFVFMHIPPPISDDISPRAIDNPEKMVDLADKYDIDYVIAGDYHGYARVKHKNTVYLVTAGGGAHISNRKFGNFHHATVIQVSPNSVSEKLLYVPRVEDFEDRLERYALAVVFPWLNNHWLVAIVLNLAILGGFLLMLARVLRKHRISSDDVSKKL